MDRQLPNTNSGINSDNSNLVYAELIRRLLEAQNSPNTNTAAPDMTAQHLLYGISTPQHQPWQPGGQNGGIEGNGKTAIPDTVAALLLGPYHLQQQQQQLQQQQQQQQNAYNNSIAAAIATSTATAAAAAFLAAFLGTLQNYAPGRNALQTNLPQILGLSNSADVSALHVSIPPGECSALERRQAVAGQDSFFHPPSFVPREVDQSGNAPLREPQLPSGAIQLPTNHIPLLGMMPGLDGLALLYGIGSAAASSAASEVVTSNTIPSVSADVNSDWAPVSASAEFSSGTIGSNTRIRSPTVCNPDIRRKRSRGMSSSHHHFENNEEGTNKKQYSERRAYNAVSFAQKLFKMITDQEASGKRDVVEFLDGGGGFWLHNRGAISVLMPQYDFRGTKFSGFRRQLTSYGFRVDRREGPEKGAFKNPLFSRGRPDLCSKIIRNNEELSDDEEGAESLVHLCRKSGHANK